MRPLAQVGIRALALLLWAGAAASAHAQGGTVTRPEAHAGSRERSAAAPPAQGGGAVVVSPDEQAAAGETKVPPGPGVELITGGNSADGAARIGRLPILE